MHVQGSTSQQHTLLNECYTPRGERGHNPLVPFQEMKKTLNQILTTKRTANLRAPIRITLNLWEETAPTHTP